MAGGESIAHLGGPPSSAAAAAQDLNEAVQGGTRSTSKVKETKEAVTKHRTAAPGQKAPNAAAVDEATKADQTNEVVEKANAAGVKRKRSADEPDSGPNPKKAKREPAAKQVNKQVANYLYDENCCHEAIKNTLPMISSGMVRVIINSVVNSVQDEKAGTANLSTIIKKFHGDAQDKDHILFFALNAALQDKVKMEALSPSVYAKLKNNRDALLTHLGGESSVTSFVQNGNLVAELGDKIPGISLRVVAKLMRAAEEGGGKGRDIGGLIEHALKANPGNPDAVLQMLYEELSAKIQHERGAISSFNVPGVK